MTSMIIYRIVKDSIQRILSYPLKTFLPSAEDILSQGFSDFSASFGVALRPGAASAATSALKITAVNASRVAFKT